MKILRNIRNISSGAELDVGRGGWGAEASPVSQQRERGNNNNSASAAVMCRDKLIILTDTHRQALLGDEDLVEVCG